MEQTMGNDEFLKEAIQQLALGLLYKEYGKDLKNEELIRALADGRFDEFVARTNGDHPI